MLTNSNRILNWKPSPIDRRDYKFSSSFRVQSKNLLPVKADLTNIIPEVWDQGDIGSCVFNSTGMGILYQSRLQNREIINSRLFHYYITREIEDTINCDCGAWVRDAFKTLNKTGVCKEASWPYITNKFTQKPSDIAYAEAPKTIGLVYHALNNSNLNELKTCIAELNKPFVFGFNVYESFMGNWRGSMPIPKRRERLLGGHAVIAVGYDDTKQAFKIKNSWGTSWGEQGYFWMPYSFIKTSECDDFWVLEKISDGDSPTPPTPDPKTGDTAIDISKVFANKAELNRLPESIVVRIGSLLNLDVDMKYTKKKNVETVSKYLNLM